MAKFSWEHRELHTVEHSSCLKLCVALSVLSLAQMFIDGPSSQTKSTIAKSCLVFMGKFCFGKI